MAVVPPAGCKSLQFKCNTDGWTLNEVPQADMLVPGYVPMLNAATALYPHWVVTNSQVLEGHAYTIIANYAFEQLSNS